MADVVEHDPAACEAITAELVRLTMGGRPGRESWHLSIALAARLKRIGRQLDDISRTIGIAFMPVMGQAVRAMADMQASLAKVAEATNRTEKGDPDV